MAERSAVLLRAMLVGVAAGLALVVAQTLLFSAAFMVAPASDRVEALAGQYLSIRIWGAPATIALYALTGWLVGLGRTRGVLALQLWQNGINVLLDVWFVLGLGWGVPGVAISTLIAEWSGLALALWLARDAFGVGFRDGLARLGDRVAMRRMFTASRDIMGRTVLLQLSFTSFVFLGARFGDVPLAANQVLMQFLSVTAYALDGFAFAAEALVGQAVGARSGAATRAAGRVCMQLGLGGAAGMAALIAVGGPFAIDLLTTSPEVREAARDYLPWLVAAPLIGVAAWIYDGIFIGALLTGDMLRAMFLTVVVYAVALAFLVPAYGNHGLWAGLMILNATRTVTLWRLYPRVTALAARA
jgi:MATE family multidrug resistance protein